MLTGLSSLRKPEETPSPVTTYPGHNYPMPSKCQAYCADKENGFQRLHNISICSNVQLTLKNSQRPFKTNANE